ncbi:MAG TPA: HD-GYP domain-containing protein [Candidatus Limnocylindria bacterium]|nr:HD-GYP domain-containing protein [Candidatus Limnocylindria bacterium]
MEGERATALHTGLGRNVELTELASALSEPTAAESKGPEIFRQLLQQAIRVSEQANAQALRMAQDFAAVYQREQRLAKDFESKLGELALLERQATRYAEDLATLLRLERERRRELERSLVAEQNANVELRRTGLQGVSHILMAVSLKDMTTGQHLLRVRKYVEAIAGKLGLSPATIEEFGYSSVLHDVGKIQTPDDILGAPHELSVDQYDVMKEHCIDGEAMLGDAMFFATGRAVAREHHERWDGTGYPDRKSGERISLAARIVAVADVYDALTSKRPYKEAWSPERGLAAIEAGSGKQFDPGVVAAFVSLYREGAIERIRAEVGDQP